jgi:hypothetical protein
MNAVTNTWRQLVRNKLWPVAVLLLAALVAVPFLLAREPEAPEPLAPLPVTGEADDSIAEPVVAKVTSEDRDRRRRVLGVRKDPFAPAPVKPAKAKAKARAGKAEATPTPESQPSSSGGSGGATTGGEPAPEKVYYEPGTVVVRFGEASATGELARVAIPKFGAVPDDELPLLVYMGLTKDGKRAKFLVDASVEVDGDGRCKPHPGNCETIELAVGETEYLDVLKDYTEEAEPQEGEPTDEETEEEAEPEILATFQLDLVAIKRAGDPDVR